MAIDIIKFGWDFFGILHESASLLWAFFMSNIDPTIAEIFGLSTDITNLEFLMVSGIVIALISMAVKTIVGIIS